MQRSALIFATITICWVWPALASALTPGTTDVPSARAAVRSGLIAIDGKLDEAACAQAPWTEGFIERKPGLRAQPPVQTRFALLYDRSDLYVAVFCGEPDTNAIVARSTTRDNFAIFSDDAISLKLDPSHDQRTTIGMVLNPVGARLDYRGVNETSMRREWDGIWTGAASVVNGGWVAEFRIPWSTLGVDPASPPAVIGLNFSRDHARRNATYDWALMPPPYSPISASRYGHIEGLQALASLPEATSATASAGGGEDSDAHSDRGLLVVPWALAAAQTTRPQPWDGRLDAGLDLLVRRGTWRAQATLNTDFAQADVDDAVVNLDRFSLQMPEKRDFFLRDVERFTFGRSDAVQALYSRKIGLDRGKRVPIAGGAKIVGEIGERVRIGALDVITRPEGDLPWTSHSAVRGQVELPGGSNVGAIWTQRQSLADGSDNNAVFGLDGALRGGRQPLLVEAFALVSRTGAQAGRAVQDVGAATGSASSDAELGAGGGVSASWRGLLWRPSLRWLWSSQGLRSDLGYLRRVGVHEADATLVVEPRFSCCGLERLRMEASTGAVVRDGQLGGGRGGLLDANASAGFDLVWNAGWLVGAEVERLHETVLTDFDAAGSTVKAGAYDMTRWLVGGETPSVRTLSAWVDLTGRDYYGGDALGATGGLTWRPGTWLRLELGSSAQRLRLGASERLVVVSNTRAAIGFNPNLNLDLYACWDRQNARIPLMARLRWTWRRGSDIFVVWQSSVVDGVAASQSAIVKATFAWM